MAESAAYPVVYTIYAGIHILLCMSSKSKCTYCACPLWCVLYRRVSGVYLPPSHVYRPLVYADGTYMQKFRAYSMYCLRVRYLLPYRYGCTCRQFDSKYIRISTTLLFAPRMPQAVRPQRLVGFRVHTMYIACLAP